MSTSRAIKKRKRDDTQLANYTPMPERAPSVERADTPAIARVLAHVGPFLIVLIAVIRNETELQFRTLLINALGFEGALMIAFCAYQSMRDSQFLPGEGVAILLLALGYVGAYIGQEPNSERSHYAALGLGA